MKNFFLLILGLILILGSIFLFFERISFREDQTKIVKINGTSIEVEVVDTSETRAQGLSGREVLPEGTGMLFIFNNPGQYEFWMKDMNFAIDIVWIKEDFYIVGIEKNVSPGTFPQIFYPSQDIKYVLELPSGYTEKYSIDTGAVVQWFD